MRSICRKNQFQNNMATFSPIIDGLVHLEKGLVDYDLEAVAKNIVFNFVDQYREQVRQVPAGDAITLVFDYKNNLDFVLKEAQAKKIRAFKIHSRDQKIKKDDYACLIDKLSPAPENLPILIDCFYYGPELEFQPSLQGIIQIAEKFPNRSIVIVHCGGYRLLQYFHHLRPLKNIYYDLSFTLQYLEDSSIFADLKKLIRFTNKSRIIFGSDYPHASPKKQALILEGIISNLQLNAEEKKALFHDNAKRLYFEPYCS